MLTYSLALIKYSPKKLAQLAGQLKGELHNILSFLHYCNRVKICTMLNKFFLHLLNDIVAKFGTHKHIFISECYVARAGSVKRAWFAAKGKLARRIARKSNLKVNVLLI
ncbi:MAG: uL22 family ribosomal protein [Candidatus Hodgkinia cicadicola]